MEAWYGVSYVEKRILIYAWAKVYTDFSFAELDWGKDGLVSLGVVWLGLLVDCLDFIDGLLGNVAPVDFGEGEIRKRVRVFFDRWTSKVVICKRGFALKVFEVGAEIEMSRFGKLSLRRFVYGGFVDILVFELWRRSRLARFADWG